MTEKVKGELERIEKGVKAEIAKDVFLISSGGSCYARAYKMPAMTYCSVEAAIEGLLEKEIITEGSLLMGKSYLVLEDHGDGSMHPVAEADTYDEAVNAARNRRLLEGKDCPRMVICATCFGVDISAYEEYIDACKSL